ncbi:OsmC family protein [Liquorilactobacillus satsumensis]|nr:OsmC family protein [Liquorilactobacillus satsumensis]MCP9312713.1 OsmC family protein [Liquorilactobacillus satsumensis]MCP9328021.1 OsmC family protein [Liquorilactobacillus satsumensis]MCP9358335.1 OsmC family protein [Liquorilactobacillus satsumensis]MCP9359274.1 OsmC family protein [Liquorilactobacillus satsumensis]MCP9372244.1 OsmC family protein [Liquorilactobacillus satsumensis]
MAYKVETELRKIGAQVKVQVREHTFLADEPLSLKGTDAGPNPVEYLLSALGGCLSITAADINSRHPEIGLEKFETEIKGRVRRFSDKTSKLDQISIKFNVVSQLDEKQQHAFIKSVIKYCTVHASLDKEIKINYLDGDKQ